MSRLVRAAASITLGSAVLILGHAGVAGASSGVIEALEKKYVVTETTPDREQITKLGGVMDLKVAGVYTLPTSTLVNPDNKVVDGKVQAPSMIMRVTWTKVGSAHVLQPGEKVYVTKIERKSDFSGESLRFTVLTVEALDAGTGQKKFDGTVSFKFKKGYLDETPPEEVETAVEAVLAPDEGGDNQNQANGNGGPPTAPQAPPPPARPMAVAAPPPPPPAAPPATINIGETSTEVLQSMGMPLQMIDLGKKKTYIYKSMKVIFINDKVSDVQ